LAAERRAAARREASKSLPNSNWRCILNVARTIFRPRRAKRGEGEPARRLRRILSKLPKNRKKYRLEPYFVKENFYNFYREYTVHKLKKFIYMKDTVREKIEKAFKRKLEEEKIQKSELQKYLKEAKDEEMKEDKNIMELWKKLAKELNSGVALINLAAETKNRIFSHYRFLLIDIAKRYATNPYLTLLELVRAGEKGLWKAIGRFGYKILNEFLPQNKQFSEDDFINMANASHFFIDKSISDAIVFERQKILGHEGLSVFIHRDKNGRVTNINYSGIKGDLHVLEEFVGTDKEKQEFAEKYEKEVKELKETERELTAKVQP